MSQTVTADGFVAGIRKRGERGALCLLLLKEGSFWAVAPLGNKIGGKSTPIAASMGSECSFDMKKTHAEGPWSIVSFSVKKRYLDYSASLASASWIMLTDEIIEKLFPGETVCLYDNYLKALQLCSLSKYMAAMALFLAGCLDRAGVKPETRKCVDCLSEKNLITFSFERGGYLCTECASIEGLTSEDRKTLLSFRYLLDRAPEQCEAEKLDPAFLKRFVVEAVSYLEDYFSVRFDTFKMFLSSCDTGAGDIN